MKIKTFDFPDVVEFVPFRFSDERGFLSVTYDKKLFKKHRLPTQFVQDNESFSKKGTLRGLHFQKSPRAQGKLIRVIQGKVQDVIVDLRKGFSTFKQWISFEISAEKGNIVYVPEGFAHGFLALEDTIFSYKCTQFYDKSVESGIKWDDQTLGIAWKLDAISDQPLISEKDLHLPSFDLLMAQC